MGDEPRAGRRRRHMGAIVATFAAVGPLIGAVALSGIMMADGVGPTWFTVLAGYVFGLIPAVVTGCFVADRAANSGGPVPALTGALIGGVVSLVAGFALFALLGSLSRAGLFAALGAVAGGVCTMVTRRWH